MRQLEHGGTSWFDPSEKFVFLGFLMLTGSSAKEEIKCPQLNLGWWREESQCLLEMQSRECWCPSVLWSREHTGIGGGAEAGEAQECIPVLPLAQGAAHLRGAAKTCHGCSQGQKFGFLALYFLLCFFSSIFSAVTLQLAHGAEVLQVSDVLLLVAIFIS